MAADSKFLVPASPFFASATTTKQGAHCGALLLVVYYVMARPIIGDLSDECDFCGTWMKASAKVCPNPNCKKPNRDYKDRNEVLHNTAPHGMGPVKIEREGKYEDD